MSKFKPLKNTFERITLGLFYIIALEGISTSASSRYPENSFEQLGCAPGPIESPRYAPSVPPAGPDDMLIETEDHSFLGTLARTTGLFVRWIW